MHQAGHISVSCVLILQPRTLWPVRELSRRTAHHACEGAVLLTQLCPILCAGSASALSAMHGMPAPTVTAYWMGISTQKISLSLTRNSVQEFDRKKTVREESVSTQGTGTSASVMWNLTKQNEPQAQMLGCSYHKDRVNFTWRKLDQLVILTEFHTQHTEWHYDVAHTQMLRGKVNMSYPITRRSGRSQ